MLILAGQLEPATQILPCGNTITGRELLATLHGGKRASLNIAAGAAARARPKTDIPLDTGMVRANAIIECLRLSIARRKC